VFYAGGNDINAGKTPEQVFGDFCAFVAKVRATLPESRIAYISIAPNPARWMQVDRVKAANRLIEDFTKANSKLTFINVFPHMLGEDGRPRPEIFVEDRLHMNAKGYEPQAVAQLTGCAGRNLTPPPRVTPSPRSEARGEGRGEGLLSSANRFVL